MSRTRNDRLLNVGSYVAHDYGLQCAEGLLGANGKHRHGQLRLLEKFIVLRVLRKRSELRKASPHSSRLRVGCCEEVSGGFVGLAGISCEVIPYAVKIDSLTARDQPFRGRSISMKVKIPNTGIEK